MLRGVYGDRERFESTYFSQFKGYYVTGDNVRRDGTSPVPSVPRRAVACGRPCGTQLHSRVLLIH